MARPRIGKISQEQMAKLAGVTPKSLRDWRDTENIDITDEAAVMERAARKQGYANESTEEAKLRKLQAEADMIEHKLQVQKGEYVRHEEMIKAGTQAGLIVRGIILKMTDELTPKLAGKTAAEIAIELESWGRDALTQMSNYETLLNVEQ